MLCDRETLTDLETLIYRMEHGACRKSCVLPALIDSIVTESAEQEQRKTWPDLRDVQEYTRVLTSSFLSFRAPVVCYTWAAFNLFVILQRLPTAVFLFTVLLLVTGKLTIMHVYLDTTSFNPSVLSRPCMGTLSEITSSKGRMCFQRASVLQ